jgi:DNA-binding NarL/FixJ family response regulator
MKLMRKTMTRVILVDSHGLIHEAIRGLLEAVDDMVLVGIAATASAGLKLAHDVSPDVAVIEMSYTDPAGHTLVEQLIRYVPATHIVALSEDEERDCVQRALEIGAKAYVSKRSRGEQLLQAIRTAADGGIYIDPAVASAALTFRGVPTPLSVPAGSALTRRETDVVRLIALGYTAKEIGGKLGITVKSVATYKTRACHKLNLKRRPQLVRYAAVQGWIPQP